MNKERRIFLVAVAIGTILFFSMVFKGVNPDIIGTVAIVLLTLLGLGLLALCLWTSKIDLLDRRKMAQIRHWNTAMFVLTIIAITASWHGIIGVLSGLVVQGSAASLSFGIGIPAIALILVFTPNLLPDPF